MGADDYNLETDYGIELRHREEARARQESIIERQEYIIRLIKSQDPKIAVAYKELDGNRIKQESLRHRANWGGLNRLADNWSGSELRRLQERECELEAIIGKS